MSTIEKSVAVDENDPFTASTIDPKAKKIGQQLQHAEKKGFRVVALAGPDERARGVWKIKRLADRFLSNPREVSVAPPASALNSRAARWAGWLFIAGIVIFSGSLYLLVLSGQKWLGAVTPLGGLAFLAGWLCLAWGSLRG